MHSVSSGLIDGDRITSIELNDLAIDQPVKIRIYDEYEDPRMFPLDCVLCVRVCACLSPVPVNAYKRR